MLATSNKHTDTVYLRKIHEKRAVSKKGEIIKEPNVSQISKVQTKYFKASINVPSDPSKHMAKQIQYIRAFILASFSPNTLLCCIRGIILPLILVSRVISAILYRNHPAVILGAWRALSKWNAAARRV